LENPAAWEEMKKYNIHDVLSTEELYNNIKAWNPQRGPRVFIVPSMCRMCGNKTERRGYTPDKKKQKIHCTNGVCGAWDTIPLPKEEKAA
jgi:hypothetical protein